MAGLLGTYLVILPVVHGKPLYLMVGSFLLLNTLYGLRVAVKTFSRPSGRLLKPGEAPVLDELLGAAQWLWKGPRRPLRILAPDAWSVELTGVPVAGMFGWNRFHWHIGIYPMLALSLREFEALVGWEMVFWSDYQGWLNLQAKRLAAYWYRIHLHLETGARDRSGLFSWGGWFTPFLRPYARWVVMKFQPFLAREFVRTDLAIAEKHGTPTLVRALCRLAILKPMVTRRGFFQWDARLESGKPLPEDLYEHLAQVLGQGGEARGMLELALDGLQRESPPLLRLRLEYLECRPEVPLPPTTPAFRTLLEGTAVIEEIQAGWKDRIRAKAQEAGRQRAADAQRFRELSASLLGLFPNHAQSGEYLALAFHLAPWDEFDVLLRMYRESRPGDVDSSFLSIRRALQRGRDYAAVLEARELLRRDPLLAPACHEVLAFHLGRRGDQLNADKEWDRALRAAAVVEKARRERLGVSLVDPLESHRCGPSELQEIQRLCLEDPRVREAHLVQKRVVFHAERPVLLLVVRWAGTWWDPFGRKRLAFQKELQDACPFPSEATGFILVPGKASFWMFGSKLKRLNGRIFSR